MTIPAILVTSLCAGLVLHPLLIVWLKRRGVMDVPNHRSSHTEMTPRGAGVAVIAALGSGIFVGRGGDWELAAIYAGVLILGAVGLTDDVRGLSPQVRLGILLAVGALAGPLLHPYFPLALALPVMAIWVAAYVNAFNFMDGINGISGLTGLVSGVAYTHIGLEYDSRTAVVFGAALAGASVSFLPFNAPRARVFLGDVGSYSIGFVVAALCGVVWTAGAPFLLALAPTAVYLADTGTTLVRRCRRGFPLAAAHRDHVYQQLVRGGHSHWRIALLTAGFQVLVILLVQTGVEKDEPLAGAILAAAALCAYLASPRTLTMTVGPR